MMKLRLHTIDAINHDIKMPNSLCNRKYGSMNSWKRNSNIDNQKMMNFPYSLKRNEKSVNNPINKYNNEFKELNADSKEISKCSDESDIPSSHSFDVVESLNDDCNLLQIDPINMNSSIDIGSIEESIEKIDEYNSIESLFSNPPTQEEIETDNLKELFKQKKAIFKYLEDDTNRHDSWITNLTRVLKAKAVDSDFEELIGGTFFLIVISDQVSKVINAGDHFILGEPYHLFIYNNEVFIIAPNVTNRL